MKSISYYILLIIIVHTSISSFCQDIRFVTPTQYTQNDGLTSYSITKIIQDSYGFLWIGTQEGLNLFDGNRFQTFTKRSAKKYKVNGSFISDLLEDKKRKWMWVLLSYGEVCAIDLHTRTVVRRVSLDNSKPDEVKWKRCLAIKGDTLWIAGHNFVKAYHIDEKRFLPIDLKEKSNIKNGEFNIAMIYFDRQQRTVIFADGYGVIVLDKNFDHLQTFTTALLPHKKNDTKLRFWDAVMLNNKLYVGSSWGLQVFELHSHMVRALAIPSSEIINSEIFSTTSSSDTTLLLSSNQGLHEYHLATSSIISYKDANPDSNLFTTTYDIFYDSATQRAWLGTLSGAASFPLRTEYFKAFSKSGSKTKMQHLYSILPATANEIYCGDENGLYHVDTNTNEIAKIDSTGSNLMIFKDASGNIFVSNKKGLQIIDQKRIKPAHSIFPVLKLLDSDHLSCGIQYNDSLVLFGSIIQKGLTVWNTRNGTLKVYSQYSTNHVIKDLAIINYLYKAKSGDVMILTERSVIAFNPLTDQYKTYYIKDNLTNEVISNFMDMCEISNRFYIGTYGDGLIEADKQFNVKKIIRAEDGLNNTCVYRVFPQGNQSIIVTTNDGLSLINLKPFRIKNYFQTDGLHANAFEQLCGFQDGQRILAGGINGFTIINPLLLPRNPYAPNLFIKNLKINTQAGIIDTCHIMMKEITIPTDVLQTTITFSALNFTNPKAVKFAYKINELNSSWIDLGNQNFVDFIGLSPGAYTLEVRSANEDNVWNDNVVTLELIYLPKWYQTNVFQIIIGLLGALLIYGLLRYRIEQIKEQQKIRREIGNDLHDDLGSTLNTLKVFTHLAIRDPQNKEHLTQIEESITHATTGLRDMIWVLEDSDDSVFELMERIKKFSLPICVANNIKFNSNIETDEKGRQMLKTEKRNLLLIAKEAVNNSIKYSHCQTIYVSIMQSKQELKLTIADDGVGFEITDIIFGKGLKNIQYRAGQINFQHIITSTPSKGTSIELWKRKKQLGI